MHRRKRKYGQKDRDACPTGKIRFRDPGDAKSHLSVIRAKGQTGKTPKAWYRCMSCKGYHLTSK